MRIPFGLFLLPLALPVVPGAVSAQEMPAVPANEWSVPWDGRPRDPYVAPDGLVFFVGQAGNYIGRLNPANGEFKRFGIDSGTHPHNLIIDKAGAVWYSGNKNGMIGRLDPKTGAIKRYPIPDSTVRDPHTLMFDADGNIWFTAQNSDAVGHLDVQSGKIRIVKTGSRTRPYGIALNSKGVPWVNLFGTNKIAKIDPRTMEITTFDLPHERARDRRIAITSDDHIWYTDYTRGFLGHLDPATGKVDEFALPSGPTSFPYAMAVDDKDRVWVAEGGREGARLVGFDPKKKQFFSNTPVGRETNNTIRHMYFDKKTGQLWFGTDQGMIGRANVSASKIAM